MRCKSASGFWVGWTLPASSSLRALAAGAQREQPVGPHLRVFIGLFQRLVIEGDLGLLAAGSPDQGLVGVGETRAAEIRHRVDLAPDHVVEDPEIVVLQGRADAEDVVIRADDPQRPVRLQKAARRLEPAMGEHVVMGEAFELVPSRRRRHRHGSGRAGSARTRAGDCREDRQRSGRPSPPEGAFMRSTQSPMRMESSGRPFSSAPEISGASRIRAIRNMHLTLTQH